ncbi:YkvI family membrane protein [Paenibacillus amylolyticus]|uniref:YkvI family membrane protein n=1 Tax=Paenibacillus amylolyticus TaxID=1451 RepID=UPI003D974CFB
MKQAFRVLQIAFTYIGTVVGAGFATGQEILQFFTQYGKWATVTIGLSTMLFVWLGTKMMLIAHDTGSRSYEDLNKHLFGPKAGKWITWVTLLILIGVNSVMLAGAGSVFVEHLGLHYQTGLIVTLVGTYLLLGRGIQAILQMNSIVVPMMLLLSLLMITSTIHHPGASRFITLTTDSNPIQVWLSPLLYTSFNLALAQAVLVPVGNQIRSRNVLKWGGVLGGIGVGFMLMAAHFAMSAQMPGIIQFEIPMGSIAFQLGWAVQSVYVSLIFMEIFSTFVADIYGMTLQLRQHIRVHPRLITLTIMLLCYSLSQFGFSSLLSILYPIFGSLALFWAAKLVLNRWGAFRRRNNM